MGIKTGKESERFIPSSRLGKRTGEKPVVRNRSRGGCGVVWVLVRWGSELSENLGKMALAHIRVFGFLWVAHLQSACTNPADGWGSLKRHFSPRRPYTA